MRRLTEQLVEQFDQIDALVLAEHRRVMARLDAGTLTQADVDRFNVLHEEGVAAKTELLTA